VVGVVERDAGQAPSGDPAVEHLGDGFRVIVDAVRLTGTRDASTGISPSTVGGARIEHIVQDVPADTHPHAEVPLWSGLRYERFHAIIDDPRWLEGRILRIR
jgi:hypothetical protein